jgi:hypothetical protein
MTPKKSALFLLLQIAWGCGSGGGGSGVVNGTFSGKAMAVQDAIYANRGGASSYTQVLLSSAGGACSTVSGTSTPKNLQAVSILIYATLDSQSGASTAVTAPGSYQVYDGDGPAPRGTNVATVQYISLDATCQTTLKQYAPTGSVTVSAISGGLVTGTFDVTFPGSSRVTGSFNAPSCAALANPPPGSGTCM